MWSEGHLLDSIGTSRQRWLRNSYCTCSDKMDAPRAISVKGMGMRNKVMKGHLDPSPSSSRGSESPCGSYLSGSLLRWLRKPERQKFKIFLALPCPCVTYIYPSASILCVIFQFHCLSYICNLDVSYYAHIFCKQIGNRLIWCFQDGRSQVGLVSRQRYILTFAGTIF